MDNITTISSEAFERYFNTLSKLGYKSYSNVDKLLVLSVIEDILSGELSFFVTEEDYRSITNALYCIIGNNCLIDLPTYTTWDSLIHDNTSYWYNIKYRITEDSILRNTEDSTFRVEE